MGEVGQNLGSLKAFSSVNTERSAFTSDVIGSPVKFPLKITPYQGRI